MVSEASSDTLSGWLHMDQFYHVQLLLGYQGHYQQKSRCSVGRHILVMLLRSVAHATY